MSLQGTGTLYLHVGTHKTGTTSIQQALRLYREQIEAAGIALHPRVNAALLASQFLRGGVRSIPRVKGAALPTLASVDAEIEIVAQARGARADMLISSEQFCMLRTTLEALAIRSTLGRMFGRIVPILMLRNDWDWREARADQLRKHGLYEYQKTLPSSQSIEGDWYYNRAAIKAFWNQIGPMVVVDYDAVRDQPGGVLPPFAEAIGLPGLFDGVELRLNKRGQKESA